MNRFYVMVAAQAGHRCEYCRAPEVIFNCPFEVEHIIPVSRGGLSELENLALSCRACNLAKSDHLSAEDPEREIPFCTLFHPRREEWTDHFEIITPSLAITGKTPTGRATAALLNMNRPLALEARRCWSSLGLFP